MMDSRLEPTLERAGLERHIIENLDLSQTPWVDLAAAAAGVLGAAARAWQQCRRRGGRGCRDYARGLLSRSFSFLVLTDTLAHRP